MGNVLIGDSEQPASNKFRFYDPSEEVSITGKVLCVDQIAKKNGKVYLNKIIVKSDYKEKPIIVCFIPGWRIDKIKSVFKLQDSVEIKGRPLERKEDLYIIASELRW